MIKGALVGLMPALGVSAPNIVAFQFNPETLRHSWTQPPPSTPGSDPLAVQGMPGESFSFALSMDVTDQLALSPFDPQRLEAQAFGLYSRLAALEMLMFPIDAGDGLGGGTPSSSSNARAVPAEQLRTVLFVWGQERVIPVRVTSLTITEKLFDAQLHPTHADAQIELRVLTPLELESVRGPLQGVASGFYEYSHGVRKARALVNLARAAGSITLP